MVRGVNLKSHFRVEKKAIRIKLKDMKVKSSKSKQNITLTLTETQHLLDQRNAEQ